MARLMVVALEKVTFRGAAVAGHMLIRNLTLEGQLVPLASNYPSTLLSSMGWEPYFLIWHFITVIFIFGQLKQILMSKVAWWEPNS